MILNRLPEIIVAILHAKDFMLFEEAYEDVLVSGCRFAEQAGLPIRQPPAIGVHLFPLVIT
jgi:hypothetical protein